MSPFRTMLAAAVVSLLASAPYSHATQIVLEPTPDPTAPLTADAGTVQDELLRMAAQAGVIFVGQVLSITPHPSFTPGTGIVEVTFRVDQSILGCDGQSTYILREWAGLWTGGHQRYTPGQRVLILLHAPSASGLSSPVGGQDGVIPVNGTGTAPKPTDTLLAQAQPSVDLRWIQARLPRAAQAFQSSRLHALTAPAASGIREHAIAMSRRSSLPGVLRSGSSSPSVAESTHTLPLAPAVQGISLRSILQMLGAWQAQQSHASH